MALGSPPLSLTQTHSVLIYFILWIPHVLFLPKSVPASINTPLVTGHRSSVRKFFLESFFSFLGSSWSSRANWPTWSSRDPRPEGNSHSDKGHVDPAEVLCVCVCLSTGPQCHSWSCDPLASLWPVIPPTHQGITVPGGLHHTPSLLPPLALPFFPCCVSWVPVITGLP